MTEKERKKVVFARVTVKRHREMKLAAVEDNISFRELVEIGFALYKKNKNKRK